MLIMLEGCDATGKTTIANMLQLVMPDAQVVHCTADTPNDFEFFDELINIGQFRNVILDRGMYGQFVYQNWDERNLSMTQLTELELRMLKTGAKLLYICASKSKIKERLKLRGEETPLAVEEILQRFDEVLKKSILPVYYIETTNGLLMGRLV